MNMKSTIKAVAIHPLKSMNSMVIKGYRVKGGAIVRVVRGDRVRRYHVSGRRFCALRLRLAGTCEWSGYFGSSTLDIRRHTGEQR